MDVLTKPFDWGCRWASYWPTAHGGLTTPMVGYGGRSDAKTATMVSLLE